MSNLLQFTQYDSWSGGVGSRFKTNFYEKAIALTWSTNTDIVAANASLFYATATSNTTFTINSNGFSAGDVMSFTLEITNGGTYVIVWPASVKWAGGVAPTLTSGGVDIISMHTRNNGITWMAALSIRDGK